MAEGRALLHRPAARCALFIALCFSLASGAWLSWEYRLLAFVRPETADLLTMGLGYLLQAAGVLLAIRFLGQDAARRGVSLCAACLLLLPVISLLVLLSSSLPAVLCLGLPLNLLCGALGGLYLALPAACVRKARRGLVFGLGYALSILLVFLLSLLRGGSLLCGPGAAALFALLALAALLLGRALPWPALSPDASADASSSERSPSPPWALCLAVVFLFSAVKGMGFAFPSADFSAGIRVESSRLFYAAGLLLAGWVNDRNRRHGALCAAIALVLPFVSLAIAGEGAPRLLLWALDYLFYGFFAVFRAVLVMDMAREADRPALAGLGLLAGRLGDAAGTLLCGTLSGLPLIGVTFALFLLAMGLFIRLDAALHAQRAETAPTEREVFEGLALRYGLSAREKDVLRLLLAERSNAEIAQALFVSESTVKYHVHNLLQKTGCKSRQELIGEYTRQLYPRIERDA